MRSREKYEFTPVRITFWVIMTALFSVGTYGWLFVGVSPRPRNSDKAYCIMNQRNLQQAVRSYANMEGFKPGDPLDWSKLIGPGLFLETKPACSVHGDLPLSPVIPQIGTLAAPCKDPEHRPAGTEDW
jgi:hypothetical protein